MNAAVGRRLLAEFTGTGLLVAIVVGSGIAATRLTTDGALQLLVNSLVTAMGLAVLIVVFIQAGGAHFNPVVTAADWLLGRHTPRRYSLGQAAAVMACQIAGAIAGAALADAILLWDPADRTLIAANIVGTWLATTGVTRVTVATPDP